MWVSSNDFVNSKFKSIEEENSHRNVSTVEAKKVVSKIIDSKTSGKNLFTEDDMNKKFVPEELSNYIENENNEIINDFSKENEKLSFDYIQSLINNSEENSDKNNTKKRGRPRKPVDPEEANKPKLPRGRPRKPIDPEEANKPKLPRGRPRKPIDPELLNKPKLPRGRPRKQTGNI